jgi:hypothetical protein
MALFMKGAIMKHRKFLFLVLVAALVLACNVPSTPVGVPGTTTVTPTATFIAATFTPIGSTVPFAMPNDGPLNCRTGPGTTSQVLVVLAGTQSAEIVGKNPENTWWYVKNPYLDGTFCWVIGIFVNVTGDISQTAVVGVPATPTNSASTVIAVDMTISPDTINVDCGGAGEAITVNAKIQVNGPMQITAHFRDELYGDLPSHTLNFTRADIQDISDTFTPPPTEGRHRIFLIIDGVDLSDMNARKPYQINC